MFMREKLCGGGIYCYTHFHTHSSNTPREVHLMQFNSFIQTFAGGGNPCCLYMHVSLAVLGGATTETEKAVSQPVGKRGPKGGRGKRKRKALHDEDEEEEDMDSLEGGVVMETGREHTIVRLLKLFVKVSKDGERWGKKLLQAGHGRIQDFTTHFPTP